MNIIILVMITLDQPMHHFITQPQP